MESECPFCEIYESDTQSRIIARNNFSFAVQDGFPISKGHTLIIPARHVASFFDTTEKERTALIALISQVKTVLEAEHETSSFNIGINDGPEAGQTISHLHIHLIPRYQGDVPDPRGGLRWIIPDKADYWSNSI